MKAIVNYVKQYNQVGRIPLAQRIVIDGALEGRVDAIEVDLFCSHHGLVEPRIFKVSQRDIIQDQFVSVFGLDRC